MSTHERRALLKEIRYRVDFDLTAREDGAMTRTEIRFGCERPGASIYADLGVATVTKIALNGVELPSALHRDGQLELPALEQDNVLIVEADVDYSIDGDGLRSFADGDSRFVYTQTRARTAPRYMCCFLGAARATCDLRVVAPSDWSVVSHDVPIEQPSPRSAGTWRFPPIRKEPGPLGFAAGPWATEDATTPSATAGAAPRLYGRPAVSALLRSSPIPDFVNQALTFYERVLGVAYPFDQRACVFIPAYGFQATCGDGVLNCHERILSASVDDAWRRYVLWVIAHEAAHVWFGSLVEVPRPEDHWLYEGVTTYLCHRAMEELAPELHPWAAFHILEEADAHDADASPDTHPVAALPSENSERGVASLIYVKPAAAIRHLEGLIGRRALDDGLRLFLTRHALDATSDDLVRCWEVAATADMSQWAEEWLRTPGINTLELHQTTTPDGVVETCHVLQSESTTDGRLRNHLIAIKAYDNGPDGLVSRNPIEISVAGPSTPVPQLVGQPMPDLVVLNAPPRSYVKVRLEERSRKALKDSLGDLDAETRAVCWITAWEMVKDNLIPPTEFQSWVAEHIETEVDPQVRALLEAVRDNPLMRRISVVDALLLAVARHEEAADEPDVADPTESN